MKVASTDDPILKRFKAALQEIYGDQIERIVLYGSRARGEAQPDSDYDVALFLRQVPDRGQERHRLADLRVDFERDNALQAISQLRDMHGFKSVTKTALTDPSGEKPASLYLISEKPMSEADWEAQRAGPG